VFQRYGEKICVLEVRKSVVCVYMLLCGCGCGCNCGFVRQVLRRGALGPAKLCLFGGRSAGSSLVRYVFYSEEYSVDKACISALGLARTIYIHQGCSIRFFGSKG